MAGKREMTRIAVPQEVRELLLRLRAAGFAAYAVGGCVRDSLRGEAPQDWDICTSAKPQETAACFASERVILTGERFGTVTVLRGGQGYEITTFRAESGYSDSRHPDAVAFLPELRGDLLRRDFTVNAMAADAEGRVIDLFGGRDDLAAGVIRCVGRSAERFSEDALRMLRGLRFASRFGFSIAPETAAAIHALRGRLEAVSRERLRKELSGLLTGRGAARILTAFSDVACVLIPELADCIGFVQYNPHHTMDVWQHTLHVLDNIEPEEPMRLAALLHDIAKPEGFYFDKNLIGHFPGHAVAGAAMAETILKRLRYDTATVREVTELVRGHMLLLPASERAARRLLAQAGPEKTRRLLRLHRADRMGKGTEEKAALEAQVRAAEALVEAVLQKESCFSLRQLALSGGDLIAQGIPQGPEIGEILNDLLQRVIAGELSNEKTTLLEEAVAFAQRNACKKK